MLNLENGVRSVSNANNENNMEMPAVAGGEEVKMEVKSQADQINQYNNVLPGQNNNPDSQPVQPMGGGNMNQNPYMPQTPAPGSKPNPLNGVMEKVKTVDKKVLYAVIAVVVVLLFVLLLGSSGSKGVAKKYAKYYVKGDHRKIAELIQDNIEEKSFDGDAKDHFKEVFEGLEDEDVDIKSYKILDSYKYNKDKLEDFKESCDKLYGIDEDDIKGVHQYLIKLKAKVDGEPDVEYKTLIVFKVENKWYVFGSPYTM